MYCSTYVGTQHVCYALWRDVMFRGASLVVGCVVEVRLAPATRCMVKAGIQGFGLSLSPALSTRARARRPIYRVF